MVCINLLTFCSRLVWSLRGTESAYASGCDSELTALIFFLNHVSNVNSSTQVYACVCCTSTGSQPRQRRPISKAKVVDDCENKGCMPVPCHKVCDERRKLISRDWSGTLAIGVSAPECLPLATSATPPCAGDGGGHRRPLRLSVGRRAEQSRVLPRMLATRCGP
jgi:hypothetical protein